MIADIAVIGWASRQFAIKRSLLLVNSENLWPSNLAVLCVRKQIPRFARNNNFLGPMTAIFLRLCKTCAWRLEKPCSIRTELR